MLNRLLAELRHHADPAMHTPVRIAPARGWREHAVLGLAVLVSVVMIPVAIALPLLPTWPFVIVTLAALARLFPRARAWLQANRAFNTGMSLVRTRPERVFGWANRCMRILLGDDLADNAFDAAPGEQPVAPISGPGCDESSRRWLSDPGAPAPPTNPPPGPDRPAPGSG